MKVFMRIFVFISLIFGLSLSVVVSLSSFSYALEYNLTGLGHLPTTYSYPSSAALGINETGDIVGFDSAEDRLPILWDSTNGITALSATSNCCFSEARDINENGIIAGTLKTSSTEAFIWDETNGLVGLGDLLGGTFYSEALAINDFGAVVGRGRSSIGYEPFIWDNVAGMSSLGIGTGIAYDINNTGQVVGYFQGNGFTEAYVWDITNGITSLGVLPGYSSSMATSINSLGQVVGYSYDDNLNIEEAFIWDSVSGMSSLGFVNGGSKSQAWSINDLGEVVGLSDQYMDSHGAFIWNLSSGMVDLNNLLNSTGDGWKITRAFDINNKGEIVGDGYNYNDSNNEAFILTSTSVVPEPISSTLFIVGGATLGFRRFRKKFTK